jgi:hypothetical protein
MAATSCRIIHLPSGGNSHLAGMTPDLTEAEARALVQLLRRTLDFDPYPQAPRLDPLKAILAKLDPPAPRPEPLPPLKSGMGPTHGQGRRRWRG